MTTDTPSEDSRLPPYGCSCELIHMTVLVDFQRRLRRAPHGYTGVIHHSCGLGAQPAPHMAARQRA